MLDYFDSFFLVESLSYGRSSELENFSFESPRALDTEQIVLNYINSCYIIAKKNMGTKQCWS